MHSIRKLPLILLCLFIFSQCKEPATDRPPVKKIERKAPEKIGFREVATRTWLADSTSKSAAARDIVLAVNRTDFPNLSRMDSILVPEDLTGDRDFYLPFPHTVSYLEDVSKIIYFSYPAQAFAAYEYGQLVKSGATNMGRKADPTPTGLFYTNWKAEETISTFNDEWELKWNFNIENLKGVGFHQYELPGYPASHSCLRLTEKDAKFLYNWADQWKLKDKDEVLEKGTPVIVFGGYDFDGPKPWLQLLADPKALDISKKQLEKETEPFMEDIMAQQEKKSAGKE